MKISIDIIDKIFEDYEGEELLEVYHALRSRMGVNYSMMNDQYPRSVLFLANGDILNFRTLLQIDDPRDVIMDAEKESGETGHWFSISFDKIKALNGAAYQMPEPEVKMDLEEDDLPF